MNSVLFMEWKQEPSSPSSADEVNWISEDAALYWTSVGDDASNSNESSEHHESKADIASRLLNDLEHLQDLDEFIKIEEPLPFPNWEKMLPMFDMEPAIPAVKVEDVKPQVPDTQSLLKEFETVFDEVELTHGALTPPQSPPYEQVLTTLEPPVASQVYTIIRQQMNAAYTPAISRATVYPQSVSPGKLMAGVAAVHTPSLVPRPLLEILPPATPQPDVEHELAVVEELVRTRAEDMVQCGPSSPSNVSSSSSNFGDISSDDPEWIPETLDIKPHDIKTTHKRTKPYSRNVEEKKSRKKEQNKNAATRYRMKKKAEIAEILEEERGLQNQNEELENKICDIQREIKYLKNLMRDLFKAKGLIH